MFAVSPTDLEWFENIRNLDSGDVVNFWTPTSWNLQGLKEGHKFYFMLKSPVRKIGGYGTFSKYLNMSSDDAWKRYGLANGVSSQQELVGKIDLYAKKRSKEIISSEERAIGCIELKDVVTLDENEFLDPSEFGCNFSNYIVKVKYVKEYDNMADLFKEDSKNEDFLLVEGNAVRKKISRKDRKGQCLFRQEILQNYEHRCCVTGENIEILIEAAHIQAYVDERSNHPQNGLCLRADIHRLFDEGLISITDKHIVQVSSKLVGTSYEGLGGKKIFLPKEKSKLPSDEALAFQRESFR